MRKSTEQPTTESLKGFVPAEKEPGEEKEASPDQVAKLLEELRQITISEYKSGDTTDMCLEVSKKLVEMGKIPAELQGGVVQELERIKLNVTHKSQGGNTDYTTTLDGKPAEAVQGLIEMAKGDFSGRSFWYDKGEKKVDTDDGKGGVSS